MLRNSSKLAGALVLLLASSAGACAQTPGPKPGGSGGGSGTVTQLTAGSGISFSSGATCTTTCTVSSTGGGGTPGGSNTQLQWNNAGAFGGIAGAVSNGTTVQFTDGDLLIENSAVTGGSAIHAPVTTGHTDFTLPLASDTLVGLAATQTLTNKTLTGPVLTAPVLGTPVSGTLTNATGLVPSTGLAATGTPTSSTCLLGNNSWGACASGGSVSVTSASANVVVNPSPGTGTFTVGATYPINSQTGTSYTIASTDMGKLVTFNNAAATAVSLPVATTTGFGAGASFDVQNKGVGLDTITPTTSTINGAASFLIPTGTGCSIVSDGTNYQVSACTALLLNQANVWNKQQSNCIASLTATSNTYTPDGSCNNYKLVLAASNTIANPATIVPGTAGVIEVTQDGTGSRTVTWGSEYVAAGSVSAITLSTGANDNDFVSYFDVDSTHRLISVGALNATH